MYFFNCEETRPVVSIFTYIDAMLLNLERQFLSKFISIEKFHKISNFSRKFKILKLKKKNELKNFKNFKKITIFSDFKNFHQIL